MYLQITITTMVIIIMMIIMTATITPTMVAMLLFSIDNGVVVPSVVGLSEEGTDVVPLVVVVLGDETVAIISLEMDVSDVVSSIMERVDEESGKGLPVQYK